MNYLATTDQSYSERRADLQLSEIICKRVRARIFLTGDGSVEQRKAVAETNEEVVAADMAYINALRSYESIKARRQRAELVIDIWRSLEASRRKVA